MGRVFLTFAVCLAFAATLLVPFAARAAFVPACENHEWSVDRAVSLSDGAPAPSGVFLPSLAALESEGACSAARDADDELGDPRVAALCDARGASMPAPPRVLPIADARIDAEPGCGFDLSTPHVGPAPHHAPALAAAHALAQHAILDVLAQIPPAPSALLPDYPAVEGAALPGHERGIDHPPRA
jgi:hypothetical protein